ncbi:MAG: 50S ribosomal protein L7Ae [Candidatus Methanomethylicaceae archaeon]
MSNKPMFVRFDVPPEVMERAYECVKLAAEGGNIRKGANESTKAVERGMAKLLVIAMDVDPPEIVAHLPLLADDKKIPYVYVDSKSKLGKSAGIDVSTSAVAVVDPGKGKPLMEEVISRVSAIRLKGAPEAEAKPKEAPEKEKPKEEAQKEEAPKEKPKEKPKKKAAKKAEAEKPSE